MDKKETNGVEADTPCIGSVYLIVGGNDCFAGRFSKFYRHNDFIGHMQSALDDED